MRKLTIPIIIILVSWPPLLMGVWNEDKPASTTSLRNSNPEMLENNRSLEAALNREHEFSTGGTLVDQAHHKKGSARAYFQDGTPTTRLDGSAFNVHDNGSLWFDTNSSIDNAYFFLEDFSGITWTPVSDEIIETLLASERIFLQQLRCIGNFTVNTNKFTVDATNGNSTFAGTLGIAGALIPTSYGEGNGGFLDQDNMSSDADDKVASQQSIKAYVDNNIGSANYSPTAMTGGNDSNGTITLPNGLIIKWGKQILDGTTSITDTTVTTGFPNACFQAIATGGDATETQFDFQIQVHTIIAASFKIRARVPDRNSPCHWFAIGR